MQRTHQKLEAAIHQYKGNDEKTTKWINRFIKPDERSPIKDIQIGEFLYFTGNNIEILEANKSLTDFKDY